MRKVGAILREMDMIKKNGILDDKQRAIVLDDLRKELDFVVAQRSLELEAAKPKSADGKK